MPTETNRRGKIRWRGQIKIDGKIVATKWFASGRKEKDAAILWEIEQKKIILKEEQARQNPQNSLTIYEWATKYLDFVKAQFAEKTYKEKRNAFKLLIQTVSLEKLEAITPEMVMVFLSDQYKKKSGYSVNKYRKNLAAGWEWGLKYIDGFPQSINPFRAVDKFPEPKPKQPRKGVAQDNITQEELRQAIESLSYRNRKK